MSAKRNRPAANGPAPTKATNPTDIVAESGVDTAIRNTDKVWASGAAALIAWLAKGGRPFTVDELIEVLPDPDVPQRYGAALAKACRVGVVESVGATLSVIDGRPLRLWQGAA